MSLTDLDDILAAISSLPERERERLWRRLRQMELLPDERSAANPTESSLAPRTVPRSVPVPLAREIDEAGQESPPAEGKTGEMPSTRSYRVQLIFDGGSKGNPGQGYGSYALYWDGRSEPVQRLTFGPKHTNNEAEYDTLIAALSAILRELEGSQASPQQVNLEVLGDSLLVVNQVNGKWKAKEERLRERRDRVRQLLARFGSSSLRHQPRAKSVSVLGH